MRKLLAALVASLSVATCLVFGGAAYFFLVRAAPRGQVVAAGQAQAVHVPSATRVVRTATPYPTLRPGETRSALAEATGEPVSNDATTLDLLLNTNPPPNDRVQLVNEFKGVRANLATPTVPKHYQVGDQDTFWVARDLNTGTNVQVQATLRYINNVVYMWVENGELVNDADLKRSADVFATKIYPTNHRYLGTEANPGIDNDPRLHILNARMSGPVLGYFGQTDTLPTEVYRQSNQREMFYINTRGIRPGDQQYEAVLAHEFAHMIHRNQNPRGESSWITEGFGDLGMELNGYPAGHERAFTADPDLQLDAWGSQAGEQIPHYGAAYLFLSYQLNRFGVDYIRDLFASNTSGIATIQRALDKDAPGMTFDDVFADWVVANYVHDPRQGPRYGYEAQDQPIRPTVGYSRYPASGSDTVHQYGTDYIQLLPDSQPATFSFDGSDTVQVIPTEPHSGRFVWWSGRTDLSDARLTREVDLTTVKQATLQFWTWYSLEEGYDYAYVSVSTDAGRTWKPLKGRTTTDLDPNALNYGNGLNCKSGVGCGNVSAKAQWAPERMDLTPYAGQKVLLRFEQVTDEVYAAPGFAVDDIEIPEIGFRDDAESSVSGWKAEGFVRMDNQLPQKFIVQAIEFGAATRVVPIALDMQNRGTYQLPARGQNVNRVVIAISGSTPVTWEMADYQYRVQ